MNNLTIFSIPKVFQGIDAIRQQNAINSWLQLACVNQVILMGNDVGVARAAQTMGVEHFGSVNRNQFGTPLISDAYRKVQALSHNDLIMYANADIMFLDDFGDAVYRAATFFPCQFMMIGQRWDVDIDKSIKFDGDWQYLVHKMWKSTGVHHLPGGSDFFLGRRGLLADMPDFAVGRCNWDNWAISYALAVGIPVVDVSQVARVIHQGIPTTQCHQMTPEDKIYSALYHTRKLGIAIGNTIESTWLMTDKEIRPRGRYDR